MSTRPQGANDGAVVAAGVAVLGAALLEAYLSVRLAGPIPAKNPFLLISMMVKHTYRWPRRATYFAGGFGLADLVVLLVVGRLVYRRIGQGRNHVDRSARQLVRDPGIRRYTDPKGAPKALQGIAPGPQIGRVVGTGKMLRATWEDIVVEIAGTRAGKTAAVVIPAVMDAPGPVYVTSNKRDVVDATRAVREKVGEVWLFDPQRICAGIPSFWWNPLDMAGTVAGARQLAGLFSAASKEPGSKPDPYFDPEGEEFLAMLLLAAALSNRSLVDVHTWVSTPRDNTAAGVLTLHDHAVAATSVRRILTTPEKQRAGVLGTAAKMVGFVADPLQAEWVTPQDGRPRFNADTFTYGPTTLYSLSREGAGSAGALTSALTAAVLGAAERRAAASWGGRLETPLVCVLDEVTNVCRWKELPDLVSHYGSKGIVVMAFLQTWAAGVECWGREGMKKLWGAANLRVYGGGVVDPVFLGEISELCNTWDEPRRSRTSTPTGSTMTSDTRKARVFTVADLARLPRWRAVVLLSGTAPVLVATENAYEGPRQAEIEASRERYGH